MMNFKHCPKCGWVYQPQQNEFTLACDNCGFVFYINSKPTVSAIIVADDKLLLGRRRIEPEAGKWDVIGGFLNFGEHPLDGLKREVKEETGLDIEIGRFLGFFMDTYGNTGESTLNICFVATPTSKSMIAGDDISELQWFALEDIPREIAFKNGREMIAAWLKTLV